MQFQCTDDFRGPIKPLGCDLNAEAPEESRRGQTGVKSVSHLLHLTSLLFSPAHLSTLNVCVLFFLRILTTGNAAMFILTAPWSICHHRGADI